MEACRTGKRDRDCMISKGREGATKAIPFGTTGIRREERDTWESSRGRGGKAEGSGRRRHFGDRRRVSSPVTERRYRRPGFRSMDYSKLREVMLATILSSALNRLQSCLKATVTTEDPHNLKAEILLLAPLSEAGNWAQWARAQAMKKLQACIWFPVYCQSPDSHICPQNLSTTFQALAACWCPTSPSGTGAWRSLFLLYPRGHNFLLYKGGEVSANVEYNLLPMPKLYQSRDQN